MPTGDARGGPAIVLLLTDPVHRAHAWPGHPERPDRVDAVADGVRDGTGAAGAILVEQGAEPISPEMAEVVHARSYVDWLAARDVESGWLDPDTYLVAGSWAAARMAAGLTVAALDAVQAGDATVAFAVVRPPGHHAGREGGKGFCLLNNAAIAVANRRAQGSVGRIAVLDWDVHHGDGSEEIFANDPNVLYASTHQFPWYPGTGSGDGSDTVLNVPLPAETDDDGFVAAWRSVILPRVAAFRPDAIVVSAGYDAHRDDPLAWLEVTDAGFGEVAQLVGASARRLGLRGVALVLEGGYDLAAIRQSAAATVVGLLRGLDDHPPRDAGM